MLDPQVLARLSVDGATGQRPLSAASGLVKLGQRFYVVADDEHQLAVFDALAGGPGAVHPLFAGSLPDEPKARKAAKPDLEALVHLPPFEGYPHGALLALGSGSRPQRERAALRACDAAGGLHGPVREVDLAPLYAPLHARHARLNIEGAFVGAGGLQLLQRGSGADPVNELIRFGWPAVQAWLQGGAVPAPVASTRYVLGDIDGVPLCFTDGAALPDGGWVFCAAAEATDDNYADGPCSGSAVGWVTADGRLRSVWPLALRCKAEGIAAALTAGRLQLWLVTDADDRGAPALLLSASVDLASAPP
jgi:hypothetical protein